MREPVSAPAHAREIALPAAALGALQRALETQTGTRTTTDSLHSAGYDTGGRVFESLLRSLPRLDESERGELVPIKGQPPDMAREITGCPFAPRCFNVQDRCRVENPPLEQAPDAAGGHEVACFYPAEGEKLVPSGFSAEAGA